MSRNHGDGLASEQRVINELKRRNIPFSHRVTIDDFEVDIVVGQRILIEVDGYVHLTKDNIEKDQRKDEYYTSLGYTVLHITGSETHNRGALRDFGQRVEQLYKAEITNSPQQGEPLVQTLNNPNLVKLKAQLVDDAKAKKPIKKVPKLTDEELFLEWLKRTDFPNKD